MSKEIDFLETFFQTAIDKIVDNMSDMKDSKGRNRFASGVTAQNVGQPDAIKVTKNVNKFIIQIYMPTYYEYIDEGVKGWANEKNNTGKFSFKKGGKPIPRQAILDFMMNRGIVPRDYKSLKKTKQKVKIKDKLNQLAYIIGRSIKKKGIEAVPFYSSVINEDFYKSLETDFIEVYGDKLLNDLTFIFTNNQK